MKLISVVIAAYNEEKDLPKCLTAITTQEFPKEDYEIIVVDNNLGRKWLKRKNKGIRPR